MYSPRSKIFLGQEGTRASEFVFSTLVHRQVGPQGRLKRSHVGVVSPPSSLSTFSPTRDTPREKFCHCPPVCRNGREDFFLGRSGSSLLDSKENSDNRRVFPSTRRVSIGPLTRSWLAKSKLGILPLVINFLDF